MRIGIDTRKAAMPMDGIGRYIRELTAALRQVAPEVELQENASNNDVDLFHATAWSVPSGFRGPVLFTCYDLTFLTHADCHTVENQLLCLDGLLRARLRNAFFLTISQETANQLTSWLRIDSQRIQVIYPAPSSSVSPRPRQEARQHVEEKFGVEGRPILAVGTLEPRKNLDRLLTAYQRLDESLRRSHPLLLAGGGGWKNESFARRCRSIEGVHLLGPVDDDELSWLYSAAEVFAYPSLAEGFGLPVVEAMTCGAPVMTSNVSALPEVAGNAARLVDPFDVDAMNAALQELLTNAQERDRLQNLGRARAERFTWNETARQTLDLYRRVAA